MQGTSIAVPVRDTGDAMRASLAGVLNSILSALPRLLGFAAILLVGWLLSSLVARGVAALLRAVRFDDLARRSGFAGFVRNMGVRQDAAGAIAGVVAWIIRLIALVVAFDMLGLPAVSVVLQQLLLWLPNLIVALVVLVVGGLAADVLSRLVRGATTEAGFTNPDLLATVTRVTVWAFAVVVAVSQIGIATFVVDTLLVGVVGALALASGLAFGLGGRDRAARLLDELGRQVQGAGPRLEDAARGRTGGGEPRRGAEGTFAGGRELDTGWRPRAGADRRRLPREGVDRRGPEIERR